MRATLGVLITYHDERALLGECLESLRAQVGSPDEVLIYDDASEASAEDYVPRGFPAKVVRGAENRGPSYGRNVLLGMSQSEYVHFHDADDLFHPGWCQRVRRVVEETGSDAVFTEISSYVGESLLSERVLGLDGLAAGEDLVRFCIRGSMLVPAGTYRRRAVLAIGGYREALWQSEDFDFHVRLAASGIGHAVINDPLVRIRVRPAGRSHNRVEVWSSAVGAIRRLSAELPTQYRPDLADAAARVGSVLFRLGGHIKAREAFRLAAEIGPHSFNGQLGPYRRIAKAFGPEVAEWIGVVYRSLIPRQVREYLAGRRA